MEVDVCYIVADNNSHYIHVQICGSLFRLSAQGSNARTRSSSLIKITELDCCNIVYNTVCMVFKNATLNVESDTVDGSIVHQHKILMGASLLCKCSSLNWCFHAGSYTAVFSLSMCFSFHVGQCIAMAV